jgi:hypothetical protein
MSRTINISKSGGVPVARITIGQAQFGKFGLYVFESDKTTFHTIGIGHVPPGQQSFAMGDPAVLGGEYLSWHVKVAPFDAPPQQLFSVLVEVIQDGNVVNSFTDSGQFTGTTPKDIVSSASIVAV